MRPFAGILAEVLLLVLLVIITPVVPPGAPVALYLLAVQLLSTYLVHCPTHYLVGSILGIKFRDLHLGRTTLARTLPQAAAGVARFFPIVTLSTERASLARASHARRAWMYASGTVASVSSALLVAVAATLSEPLTYAAVTWVVAVTYLAFDVVFSPKTGDLMRARRALPAITSAGK